MPSHSENPKAGRGMALKGIDVLEEFGANRLHMLPALSTFFAELPRDVDPEGEQNADHDHGAIQCEALQGWARDSL